MTAHIDVTYDFRDDTPAEKDPDLLSPTLRKFHQQLWSKPLPSGQMFALAPEKCAYLKHESDLGTFFLSSDTITTQLKKQTKELTQQIPASSMPPDLGYTNGSSIIFPGNRIARANTINVARGFNRSIADRFDLTLGCIRPHYRRETSPLASTLQRYSDFFALFSSFPEYVEFGTDAGLGDI